MVNLKINLLPWRQKRRDQLQREFLNGLAAVGLVAVLLLVGAWRFYESAIDTRQLGLHLLSQKLRVWMRGLQKSGSCRNNAKNYSIGCG